MIKFYIEVAVIENQHDLRGVMDTTFDLVDVLRKLPYVVSATISSERVCPEVRYRERKQNER